MRRTFAALTLLAGAILPGQAALAQPDQTAGGSKPFRVLDVALTYTPERAKISGTNCGCFWMQGGSVDTNFAIYRGIGFAADLTAQHASDISGNVSLGKVSYLFGPRYTRGTSKLLHMERPTSLFGQALFGGMHGFDSAFPSVDGEKASADSFGFQVGGGFNAAVAEGFGLRVIDAEWVRSYLPNGGNGSQSDLRLGAGITYRLRIR